MTRIEKQAVCGALLAVLTSGGLAMAEGGERRHELSACKDDILAVCSGEKGEAAIPCLQDPNNQSKLSELCKKTLTENPKFACSGDIASVCGGAQGRKAWKCLKDAINYDKLSAGCKDAMFRKGGDRKWKEKERRKSGEKGDKD